MPTSASHVRIKALPETVWAVLTEPSYVKQWQYGSDLDTDWSVGSPIRFRSEWDGQVFEQWGTVLQVDVPHRLQYSLFAPRPGPGPARELLHHDIHPGGRAGHNRPDHQPGRPPSDMAPFYVLGALTIARLEVRTAYHMLSVRTFSERWGGAPQMDIRPDEQVSVYPPWGASIDAGSEYGPFTVVMAIGEKCEMDSAPELADMDRDWQGWMTFLDDTVDVHAFDGVQMGLDELQLSGPGEHQVRISWRYIPKAATNEYDRELWSETVIIRLDEPGQAVG